jgi:hypothetical protein
MIKNNIEEKFLELLRKPVKTKNEMKELENLRLTLEEASKFEQGELLQELRNIGVNISSVWDLVNTRDNYVQAIPILYKHLKQDYNAKIKEGIARALTVKEAKGIACKSIIDEYNKTPKDEHNLRWVYGNAISIIITEDYLDDVIDIVKDDTNGDSRQMFVTALGKLKSPKIKEILNYLIKDKSQVISKEAQKALKK